MAKQEKLLFHIARQEKIAHQGTIAFWCKSPFCTKVCGKVGLLVQSRVLAGNAQEYSLTSHIGKVSFLSSRSTVWGQICRGRAVSRTPLALRLMSMIVCLTSGKHPRLQ
jgi:hypothetical protein